MASPELLGALADVHELLRSLAADPASSHVDPSLGCLGWQLGAAVYRETYWLREVVAQDPDLTARVKHLFPDPWATGPVGDPAAICAALPPSQHLIAWAAEIQHDHLRRLATPGALPGHPLLEHDRLPWLLLQENALTYERMLSLKLLSTIAAHRGGYAPTAPLAPSLADPETVLETQGHYRIGSRGDPFAYDCELPPQAVELSSFRIARRPASNAEYLAFMEAGGYADETLWDPDGLAWLAARGPGPRAPLGWRQDERGRWYRIGLNGPADLPAEAALGGICRHEAQAFAAWTASQGGAHSGAVLQHEYQWELAARSGTIEGAGQVWEWCANPFHPYPAHEPFPVPGPSTAAFERGEGVLRGASLHTQRCLRRASFRRHARPDECSGFAGLRLVYPPE